MLFAERVPDMFQWFIKFVKSHVQSFMLYIIAMKSFEMKSSGDVHRVLLIIFLLILRFSSGSR